MGNVINYNSGKYVLLISLHMTSSKHLLTLPTLQAPTCKVLQYLQYLRMTHLASTLVASPSKK